MPDYLAESNDGMGTDASRRVLAISRRALATGGVLALGFALLADRFGFGSEGSLGIGQVLLGLFGALAFLAGVLGRRFVPVYRDSAALLLSVLLAIAFLELVAIVVGRTHFDSTRATTESLPYYETQPWSRTYWQEASAAVRKRYAPYVGWSHEPFVGETLTVDEEGHRLTPGADCGGSPYRVFAFGGSTMRGWGAPDWGTIPAYLQEGLEASLGSAVCVVNLGQDGFVSTQSVIALALRLRAGDVPDAVVFYDGVNDVLAAAEAGVPGTHVTLERLAARFEQREHPLTTWLMRTRLYAMASRIQLGGTPLQSEGLFRHPDVDPIELGRSSARLYLGNHDLVRTLSAQYGFEFGFFLQPHLALAKKPLTPEEESMREPIQVESERLADSFYQGVRAAASSLPCLWDVSGALDAREEQIFIDTTGHVTPPGNRLIVEEMLGRMAESGQCFSTLAK